MDSPIDDAGTVVDGGGPDPPKLPPKSPLRGLRGAPSLNALVMAAEFGPSDPSSSSTPATMPTHHRPPPIIVPPLPPLPAKDSLGLQPPLASVTRSTSTRSLSSRPQSLQASRRPSAASSILSIETDLGALQDTPTSMDSISRIALAHPSDLDTLSIAVAESSRPTDTDALLASFISRSRTLSFDHSLPVTPASASATAPSMLSASASASATALPPQTSKRTHALIELLTSERVYASDLAVLRHVHIPLALGQKPHIQLPTSESNGSGLLSSETAALSLEELEEPPMTSQDVRVIFSNTEELAVFADAFAERIEASMGDALLSASEGASLASSSTTPYPKDSIGALFLEVAPLIKQLYIVYITRHPLALSRLASLTAPVPSRRQSSGDKLGASTNGNSSHYNTANNAKGMDMAPAMKKYLATARTLTERHTNAWDLPSLLIKPVQRLLKYPLLLQTLISSTQETDPSHPDLPNLVKAKDALETIARDVNEARRRWEIVKAVLDGYGFGSVLPSAPSSVPHSSKTNGQSSGRPGPTVQSSGSGGGSGSGLSTFARAVNVIGAGSRANSTHATPKRPSTAGQGVSSSSPFGRKSGQSGGGGDDDIVPNPLSRIQSLKTKLKTSLTPSHFTTPGAAQEARDTSEELQAWELRLKQCEAVLRDTFNQLVVDWSRSVRDMFGALGTWAVRFGRVLEDPAIFLQERHAGGNDAVGMFVEVVRGLLIVWTDLDSTLQSTLHPLLTSLLGSLSRPLTLVQHCIALHPLHLQHLNTPYAKSRSPYLLSSSKTFLSLLAQLRLEIPRYFELFDKGFGGVVMRISKLQARFWEECFSRWSLYALSVGVDVSGTGIIGFEDGGAGEDTSGPSLPNGLPASGATRPGMVSARRASAHSSGSASSISLQRQSKYTTSSWTGSGAGVDAASSSTTTIEKDNSVTSALAHFHDRWDGADKMIHELTLLQPRLSRKARMSASSEPERDTKGKGKETEEYRASTSSSLLAATYEFLAPTGNPSPRSSTNSGTAVNLNANDGGHSTSTSVGGNRQRSNTSSSLKTVASPMSFHSSTISRSSHTDWSHAVHEPSSVNAPPLSGKQLEKRERKKREKAERDEAIRLVEERAKAEKAAAKAAGRKSNHVGHSSFAMGGFFPGAMFSSSSSGNKQIDPSDIPRRSSSLADDPSNPVLNAELVRRRSKASERSGDGSVYPRPPASASDNPNMADRTRDVLFGLMPSSGSDGDEAHPPTLPSLSQISPLGLSMGGSPPLSPVMPGDYSRAAHNQRNHPFASHGGGRSSLDRAPGSPPRGDGTNGLWESLFDASQQSYKFQSQEASPGTPSPIARFDEQQQQMLSHVKSLNFSASTSTRPRQSSTSSSHHRSSSKHSRSRSVPPQPTPAQPPLPANVRFEDEYTTSTLPDPPSTPPSMYETLYVVTCVHPFHPPRGAIHHNLPFLSLEINDVVDILLEDGHPSTHEDLPIYVDDGDDCMLVGRDERDNIGWCLASFVMPLL